MWRSVLSFGALGAVAIGLTTPASAAPADMWSGFSISAGGGVAKTDTDLNVDTSNADRLRTITFFPFFGFLSAVGQATGHAGLTDDDWHGFGTVQAAYDQRIGNFVIGAFGDFDFYPNYPSESATDPVNGSLHSTFNGFQFTPNFPVANYASVSSNVQMENAWSVGGRVGYLVAPNTLLYALGGYTQAKFDGQVNLSYFNLFTGPQTLSLNVPDELRGYFVGAGGEMKVASNIALRLEYRYANYRGETDSASAGFAGGPFAFRYTQGASVQASLDEQIQTVRAAIVLKLGQP